MSKDEIVELLTIGALKDAPGHIEVVIKQTNTEFALSSIQNASFENALFSEEPDGSGESCHEGVIVLSDEV